MFQKVFNRNQKQSKNLLMFLKYVDVAMIEPLQVELVFENFSMIELDMKSDRVAT